MPFSATKLKFSSLEILANSDSVVITGIKPWYEYQDNKRTDKQLGYSYECVMLEAGYEKIDIKVTGLKPQFKQEDITASNGIKVRPVNFQAGFYNTSNGSFLTARASSFEIVK